MAGTSRVRAQGTRSGPDRARYFPSRLLTERAGHSRKGRGVGGGGASRKGPSWPEVVSSSAAEEEDVSDRSGLPRRCSLWWARRPWCCWPGRHGCCPQPQVSRGAWARAGQRGRRTEVRVTGVPARSPRREQAPLSSLRTLTWCRALGWLVGGRPDSSRNALLSLVPFVPG